MNLKCIFERTFRAAAISLAALGTTASLGGTITTNLDDKATVVIDYNKHIDPDMALVVGKKLAADIWDAVCNKQKLPQPCNRKPGYYTTTLYLEFSETGEDKRKLGQYGCLAVVRGKGLYAAPSQYLEELFLRCHLVSDLKEFLSSNSFFLIRDVDPIPTVPAAVKGDR